MIETALIIYLFSCSFITTKLFHKYIDNRSKILSFKKNNLNKSISEIATNYIENPDRNRLLVIYDSYGNRETISIYNLLSQYKDKIDYQDILDKYTEIKKYNKNEVEKCCISLENISKGDEIRVLNCNHFFLKKYVDNWLRYNPNCPLCRKSIFK